MLYLLGGFLDGYRGLFISVLVVNTVFISIKNYEGYKFNIK